MALVVPEDPVEPAVQESPAVPVAPERELAQVAVDWNRPGGGSAGARPSTRPAGGVALRTKSVTAAHRRDLVPLLEAAEDLVAAVAETTREPAAAEAVIAWEVADTVAVEEAAVAVAVAAVVVAAVAAVAVVAVAEDGDKRTRREKQ